MKRFRSRIAAMFLALTCMLFVVQPLLAVPPFCEYWDSFGYFHVVYEGLIPGEGWNFMYDEDGVNIGTDYGDLGDCPTA